MIYLLYGKEFILMNEFIEEIKNKYNLDKYNIEQFDLENDSLKNIVDAANTISLFNDQKIIIVDNSYIFTSNHKKIDDKDIEYLDNYLDNLNDKTILIFKTNNETIDSRKKIVIHLKKVGNVKEFNNTVNLTDKIKDFFKPYKIDLKTINHFIERVGDDLDIIYQESEKIKIYKDKDEVITIQDIDDLTTKNINTDIFYLIDNILNNNKDVVLECYQEMLKKGEEPIKILIMIANQYRLILQVKELFKKGYKEYDIADILEQKPYTIKKALERNNKYQKEELLSYLHELADLDANIKSGLIDKNIGFELFLLNIKKEH